MFVFCFFKQKTAYEMRISDWSSDVCSSDLGAHKIRALRCDSADAQALQMTITSAAGEHDGIEVLVNNAGAGVFRSIEEQIGRARVGKECVSTCSSRWSPYH